MIAKVSKGSKMDQIYLSKNRFVLPVGSFVKIEQVKDFEDFTPYYYKVSNLEKAKVLIMDEIFKESKAENVLIVGSFLEPGFNFNDLDVIEIGQRTLPDDFLGLPLHIIVLTDLELLEGYLIEPIYRSMLSRFVSKKRILLKNKTKIVPIKLDLALLESKFLIDNLDDLSSIEFDRVYKGLRNVLSIKLFLEKKDFDLRREFKLCFGMEFNLTFRKLLSSKDFRKKLGKLYKKLELSILNEQKKTSKANY